MTSPDSMASRDGPLALKSGGPPPDPRQRHWERVQAVVIILFCLEVGVVLMLFPWSTLWDRNYFFALAPGWGDLFASSYLRGAVSGVGIVNLWIAASEAWRLRAG